jgi:antitoxin component YwqK of YwqJK toxin-antitoxin module
MSRIPVEIIARIRIFLFKRIGFQADSFFCSGARMKVAPFFLLFAFLGVSFPSEAQFWKDWFRKKPEERGVLGGKESLQERIKSRTLDDGEDVKPLVFVDSAASDKRVVRKKKAPKRMFFGVMTKKAFIRKITGRKTALETFFFIKKGLEFQPFVKDIFWFHTQKKKIFVGLISQKDRTFAKIMHGPYKKMLDGKTEEEGIYYFGARHGRWMYEKPQGDEMVVVDKEKYYKGFPKESIVSYFDADKTKIKEVIPVRNGERDGEYYRFSETGNLLAEGLYEYGRKIGKWTDYFDTNKRKIRRQLQYGKTWEDKTFQPYTLVEYDEKGKVIYDKAVEDKKKLSERKSDPTKEF